MQTRPWLHGASVHIGLGCADPIGAPVLSRLGWDRFE